MAARFALTGFVENLEDGRVHCVFEGESAQIAELMGDIHLELGRFIQQVCKEEREPTGEFDGFEIHY